MRNAAGWVVIGGMLVAAIGSSAWAQSGRTARDGVYTEEQATSGERIYYDQCATCHGDNLEGMGPMPPLSGADFLVNWSERTVGDLFAKNHETMPATAPGTLTPEQAAQVTAFLLKSSNFPAGKVALAAQVEPLREVKIGRPAE